MAQIGAQFVNAVQPAPVGTIIHDWPGQNIPAGWIAVDGQAVSRTQYADLFSAIGTTYGAGDGSTTFNVPKKIIESVANGDVTVFNNLYRPNRPMFYAHTPAAYTTTPMPASSVAINVGGHYNSSTYRFTAPYNGYYQFIWHEIGEATSGSTLRYYLFKNGVNTAGNGSFQVRIPSAGNYGDGTGIAVMNASAGDYFYIHFGGGTSYGTTEYGIFAGWMF